MRAEDQTLLSGSSAILTFAAILAIPLAIAGLMLINSGLNRSRTAAHLTVASLCLPSVAMLVYLICGFAWQNVSGYPAHRIQAAGRSWDWLGSGPFFLRGFALNGSENSLIFMFQLFAVALAAIIPISSAAERWRLGASCASTALLAGWTYPLFAHWVWAGGWLARLGFDFGLGHGFLDPAGASSIHVVSGLTALSIAWILGPRRGKFTGDGMPTAMPGHNAVFGLFGCLLAWIGWLGLNSAGAMLFVHAAAGLCVLVVVNTSFSAASAALAALLVTRVRFGRPDASITGNGWICGLVASSATSLFVKPAEAVIVGLIAGSAVIFAVEIIELRMKVDDPAGTIAVHAVGGIWGILAVGVFGHFAFLPEGSNDGQFLAQLIGAGTLLGFILPLTYSLNWLLNRILPLRVAAEGERQGMDLFELGAGAYPEFLTRKDDFILR